MEIQLVFDCLKKWPEIGVALLCLLSFIWYYLNYMNKVAILNWPFLGELPTILYNVNRLLEWYTDVFNSLDSNSFYTKSPIFPNVNYLVTCDPQNFKFILNTHFSNFNKGPGFMEIFDILGDGLLVADSDSWISQRKMAHVIFTSRDFRDLVSNVSKSVVEDKLVPLLLHMARLKSSIDVEDICSRCTYDTVFYIIFGMNPGYLQIGLPTNKIAKAVQIVEEAIIYRHVMPNALWKFLRLLNIGSERKLKKATKTIDRYLVEQISSKKAELLKGRETKDLSSMYMNISQEGERSDFMFKGEKFLRDTMFTMLVAGWETTSTGIAWFFLLISRNPYVEAKIMEELNFLRSKKIKGEKPFVFAYEDLKGLVYLDAAIYESLRLYPPLPYNHKGVVEEGVLPDGSVVKPGMKIILSTYSLGRRESIWGKDSLEYKPERWIGDDGKLRLDLMSKFFVFNVGPRSCVGKDMAFTLMKTIAAAVIFNFHLEQVKDHQVSLKPSVTLQTKYGLRVKLEERA